MLVGWWTHNGAVRWLKIYGRLLIMEERPNKHTENKKEMEKADNVIPNGEEGGIQMTQRGLYVRDEPVELKARQQELHRLGITRHPRGDLEQTGDTLASTRYKNLVIQRAKQWGKIVRFSGSLLLVIFLVVWAIVALLWYRSRVTVTEEQVNVRIEAPQEFTAGEEIIYKIVYQNDSRVDWQNVELVVTPPRGFIYKGSNQAVESAGRNVVWRPGDLSSGQTGELHIRGQLIGEQNETATVKTDIIVTPINFPSGRFVKSVAMATTITALPLEVALDIPKDAATGERVGASIHVRNLSNNVLGEIYLKLKFAENVELDPEDVDFTAGYFAVPGEWRIATLNPLESREFNFIFYVTGQPGETKVVDVEAGIRQNGDEFTQRKLTHVVTVSASEVLVEQRYNGEDGPVVITAGEPIEGEVKYSNVGTVGLKGVIVKVRIEGIAFDASTLKLTGGAYSSTDQTITWSAATIPELAVLQPNQEGIIKYSFSALPTARYPAAGIGAKNNVIVSVATVDSPDIPTPVGGEKKVVSSRSVLSLRTNLSLGVDAFYDDGRLGIKSTGPVPPQVGQTTTYTVRFRAGSSLNDVSDMRLVAVLPDGVSYTGESFKTGGEMTFDERTGELMWSLPLVEGGVGRTKPPQELHIQVSITPGEDLRGAVIDFLNRVTLDATDQFVDESITETTKEFPSTETAALGRGMVE